MTNDQMERASDAEVERVARAIYEVEPWHEDGVTPIDWGGYLDLHGGDIAQTCRAQARAAIAAMHGGAGVTEGWVLVPKEPDIGMLAAWWRQKNTGTQELGGFDPRHTSDCDAYRAMLNAAPSGGVVGGGEIG